MKLNRISKAHLGEFTINKKQVRAWFQLGTIFFRKKKSRKIKQIALRELYKNISGEKDIEQLNLL